MTALATIAVLGAPQVTAVRLTTIDHRPALRVLGTDDLPPCQIVREGGFVVIRLPASAPAELPLPEPQHPLLGLSVERTERETTLRIAVPPDVPFEGRFEPGMLTVLFGAPPGPQGRGPVTPELYRELFPTGFLIPAEAEDEGLGPPEARAGWVIGRVALRPYLTASYVDADVLAFDSPVPVRDRFLQVQPGLTASLPVASGTLALEYEPRLRFFSSIEQVNETSHFAGARLDAPLGSRTLLRAGYRFTAATLETTVVDPGREYFFDLARFHFNEVTLGARVELGPRLWLELDGAFGAARFDETQEGGFFDYDRRTGRAGVGYDVGSDARVSVSYGYEHLPPSPDRPVVESTAHSLLGTVQGPIGPLTTASLTLGYRSQENPLAPPGGDHFDGFTVTGLLRRDLGVATRVELVLNRATEPSAFEQNAFYVTNSVQLGLHTDAPLELWVQAGARLLWNDYRTTASAIGEPREDRIFGWSLGVGRSLGARTWVRVDYQRDDRESNLPGFDVTTSGFSAQVGIGLFAPGGGRP
jgi:hypothetical protein